jgi:hypothetical protein
LLRFGELVVGGLNYGIHIGPLVAEVLQRLEFLFEGEAFKQRADIRNMYLRKDRVCQEAKKRQNK